MVWYYGRGNKLRHTIGLTNGEQPSFDSLTVLLAEEHIRKELNDSRSGAVIGNNTIAFRAREQRRIKCWHCEEEGHTREKCYELHPELRGTAPGTGPLATPGGGRGLSPNPTKLQAKSAIMEEVSW
jgi:hypothetical protein